MGFTHAYQLIDDCMDKCIAWGNGLWSRKADPINNVIVMVAANIGFSGAKNVLQNGGNRVFLRYGYNSFDEKLWPDKRVWLHSTG